MLRLPQGRSVPREGRCGSGGCMKGGRAMHFLLRRRLTGLPGRPRWRRAAHCSHDDTLPATGSGLCRAAPALGRKGRHRLLAGAGRRHAGLGRAATGQRTAARHGGALLAVGRPGVAAPAPALACRVPALGWRVLDAEAGSFGGSRGAGRRAAACGLGWRLLAMDRSLHYRRRGGERAAAQGISAVFVRKPESRALGRFAACGIFASCADAGAWMSSCCERGACRRDSSRNPVGWLRRLMGSAPGGGALHRLS